MSSEGEEIPVTQSKYVWIGHTFEGTGVAAESQQCTVELPLTTQPLHQLLWGLQVAMKRNFYPCILTMAGTLMAFHYQTFIAKMKSCPITIAYRSSGSGKTTALHCGLGLLGADDLRFFRELTPAKVFRIT